MQSINLISKKGYTTRLFFIFLLNTLNKINSPMFQESVREIRYDTIKYGNTIWLVEFFELLIEMKSTVKIAIYFFYSTFSYR